VDSLTLATWCLVGITVVYATLTGLILFQNRSLVSRQTRPEVIAFMEVSKEHAVYLVLQNLGAGVARSIQVEVPEDWTLGKSLGPLGDVGFVACVFRPN